MILFEPKDAQIVWMGFDDFVVLETLGVHRASFGMAC